MDAYGALPISVPVSYSTPPTDTTVETLILFNRSRLEQVYSTGELASSGLMVKLGDLARDPNVHGVVVHLDDYAGIVDAYALWDTQAGNPLAANYVASNIKSLLYRLAPAYPNLKYLVLVGDDRVVPHRRIRDEALVSNERRYAEIAHTPILSESLSLRYLLSDDYYAGLLPLPWKGRELYLPQLGVGRLVESPGEMARAVDAFLSQAVVLPDDALVTGYDFLLDQASAIADALHAQGIGSPDMLANDSWTAQQLRNKLFVEPDARGLNALNAHFEHYRLFAADGSAVYATEVTDATDYGGVLMFSVGCHSGLSVPDGDAASVRTGTDWAQAFLRQGATFVGNTGYGYGDSDLIAYSERLMLNFVEELGYWEGGQPQTVGNALLRAKQRYFSSVAVGSWSTYDEKVMAEATLYGLPMLRIDMPVTTTVPPGGQDMLGGLEVQQTTTTLVNLVFSYDSHSVSGVGDYVTLAGEDGVHVVAGRPVLPLTSMNIHVPDAIAHGALMVGGTFDDVSDFDPLVSRVVTDQLSEAADAELPFPAQGWYPAQMGVVNRFLSIDGESPERLVVVPGQFQATTTAAPTIGVQRLYSALSFEVYHAPYTATDFVAPTIWDVRALQSDTGVSFRVRVEDDSWSVARVVVLYREGSSNTWSKIELPYNAGTGWAEGTVSGLGSEVEYFSQAVDPTGNVALALDHGRAYSAVSQEQRVYLPLVVFRHSQ